jgi:hypothetical protein
MLPLLAMLVTGYMARQGSGAARQPTPTGGGLGGVLGEVLGGRASGAPGQGAGPMGGLASMLDLNGDGNPLDDILGMASKLMR